MTLFKHAFKRSPRMESEKLERSQMHWRRVDDNWDVVSTTLDDKWDNATHPKNHDEFVRNSVGTTGDIPRYMPKNTEEWKTFMSTEEIEVKVFDKKGHIRFVSAFADIDYLNAQEAIDFLNSSFTAEYSDGGGFSRTFPETEDTILDSEPTDKEMKLLQFTLNKMSAHAEENNTIVSPRQALEVFHAFDNHDTETFISKVMGKIKPTLPRVEKHVRDDDGVPVVNDEGEPVTETTVDTEAVEETEQKVRQLVTG